MSIEVYSKNGCPFCVRAKELLTNRKLQFTEINLSRSKPEVRDELVARTNYHKVPQIFVNGEFIGGFSELQQLANSGELDRKLSDG